MTEHIEMNEKVTLSTPANNIPQQRGFSLGAVPVAMICATIAFIAYLGLKNEPPQPVAAKALWEPLVLFTNGGRTPVVGACQVEFWTPSAKTKEHLAAEGGTIAKSDKWQVLQNEDSVVRFGNLLRQNPYVLHCERTEVWRQTRDLAKPGWGWTMNVTTNYRMDQFAKTYQQFWNCPPRVYVEVTQNRRAE